MISDVNFDLKPVVERMWAKYENYKETAEQSQFILLLSFDRTLVPAYTDLKKNWDDEHAKIFIQGLRKVFKRLGIKDESY